MTVTYTTVVKVASLLNLVTGGARKVFSTSTIPTSTEIEEIINRKEDEIDLRIGHAWRETTITDEYHNVDLKYRSDAGIAIYLRHRKITSIDSLEIWNGSEWEEWIGSKTEGRGDDYWVNYEGGILYLKQTFGWSRKLTSIKIDYKYGDTTVPGDIEGACTKMTAIELIIGEDRSIRIPEGTAKLALSTRVEKWQDDVDKTLQRRAEILIPSK